MSVLLTLGAVATADGPAFMVKNIHTGPDPDVGSGASRFANIGRVVLFAAADDTGDIGLWRTDGTATGTQRVGELPIRERVFWTRPDGVTADGLYYFAGPYGVYRSNGTAAGTEQVSDVLAEPIVAVGGTIYLQDYEQQYIDDDGVPFWRLWASDGSSEGTRVIAEFYNDYDDPGFVVTDRQLFFFARQYASGTGTELWVSDGSVEGTRLVKDINPGPDSAIGYSSRGWLFPLGDTLLFAADDGKTGVELWRSDGTLEGTVQLSDINPGPGDGIVLGPVFAALDGRLFFAARSTDSRIELWASDGTPAGTEKIDDVGAFDLYRGVPGIAAVEGRLFYTAGHEKGDRQLRSTDGSAGGTSVVKDLPAGTIVEQLVGLGGDLLFVVKQVDEYLADLWRSDGTDEGTLPVRSFARIHAVFPTALGAVLVADDGKIGSEPWFTDGTAAGTVSLGNLRVGEGGSDPHDLTDLDGTLVFAADDGLQGDELWRSDATDLGTVLVADINEGEDGSAPRNFVAAGGVLYFSADDGQRGRELWRSNGTAGGTAIVRDIDVGPSSSSPQQLVAKRRSVYFFADDGMHGVELWRSNGKAEGTRIVKDINPGRGNGFECVWSECATVARAGELLFFAADDGEHGVELWRTDGSAAGTTLVVDLNAGPAGSFPDHLTALGDSVVFDITPEGAKPTLWRSDGSAAGTLQLASLGIGSRFSEVVDDVMFFRSDSERWGDGPDELWRSDGTPEGTFAVGDPSLGGGGRLHSVENTLFGFTTGYGGRAISSRCGFLGPSFPGDVYWYLNWYLEDATVVADRILFSGEYRDPYNLQLWTSNGTAAGTRVLQEFPNSDGYRGLEVVASGAHAFLPLRQGRPNRELWALPVEVLPPVEAESCLAETTPAATLTRTTTVTPAGDVSPTDTPVVGVGGSASGCAISAPRASPTSILGLALPLIFAWRFRRARQRT